MSHTTNDWSQSHRYLEILLVLLVLSISLLIWRHSAQDPLLLHLYYVPVVLTGFYLGSYRARVTSFLSIVTAFTVFGPSLLEGPAATIPLTTFLAFSLWSGTLLLVAVLTGSLSDGLRRAMKETESSLKKDALTDSLTKVSNRRAFDEEVNHRLSEQTDIDSKLALILVDIDYFKDFNDRYGHQTGDAVLRQVAEVFQNVVRSADLLARYGGEEFALVLPEVSQTDALQIAERSRVLIESHRFSFQGLVHRLTVSLGVAFANRNDTEQTFCERADAALYSSKAAGRNCVHHHDGKACHKFGAGFMTTRMVGKQRQSEDDYAQMTNDQPTGLPSRFVFLEELRRRVLEKQRYGIPVSVALIEFENFPDCIDSDSHLCRSVSANAARIISSSIRDADFVAHWSNGVFSVLMPSTSLEDVLVAIWRTVQEAREFSDPQYPCLSYEVSAGVVEAGFSEQFGDVVRRVTSALSEAKSSEHCSLAFHDGLGTKHFVPHAETAVLEEPSSCG